jgi:hypothetical protein
MKKQFRDRTSPAMEEDTMSEAVFEEILVNRREITEEDVMIAGTLLMTPISHVASRNSIRGGWPSGPSCQGITRISQTMSTALTAIVFSHPAFRRDSVLRKRKRLHEDR